MGKNMRTKWLLFIIFPIHCCLFSAETAIPIDLMIKYLPENAVILEAGAQFGEDTEWMSRLWPGGKIYAFEPSPISYPLLQQKALESSNIFCYQLALSDINDKMPFYLSGGASSLLPPEDSFNEDYFHVDLENPIFVETVTLDHWAEENRIEKIDFLWFDMEGNELKALQGALNHLKDIKLIYTEVNIQRFWKGCVLYEELKQWLYDQGFKEIWCEIVSDWQGNALFLNEKSRCKHKEINL